MLTALTLLVGQCQAHLACKKSPASAVPRDSVLEAFGGRGLIWSSLQKNRPVK